MDKNKEAYKTLQAAWVKLYNVEVGDTVRLLRTTSCGEMGWYGSCCCLFSQTKVVGDVMTVRGIVADSRYIELSWPPKKKSSNSCYAPFFALEFVSKAEKPEVMITLSNGNEVSMSTIEAALQEHVK